MHIPLIIVEERLSELVIRILIKFIKTYNRTP